MLIPRALAAILLFICTGLVSCTGAAAQLPAAQARPSRADVNAEAVERGRLLTARACASCHATGQIGDSPMPEATPFREIVHRYPLDQLQEGFAEGLVTAHPAMPEFVFRASEIDDLIAYLETVKDQR